MVTKNEAIAIGAIAALFYFRNEVKSVAEPVGEILGTAASAVTGTAELASKSLNVAGDAASKYWEYSPVNQLLKPQPERTPQGYTNNAAGLKLAATNALKGNFTLSQMNTSTAAGPTYTPAPTPTMQQRVLATMQPNTSTARGAVYSPPPNANRSLPSVSSVTRSAVTTARNTGVSAILARVANPWR